MFRAKQKQRVLLTWNVYFGGSAGGQVVSMLTFYSDNPSSNPAKAYCFFCKICVWKEQNSTKKRPGLAHSKINFWWRQKYVFYLFVVAHSRKSLAKQKIQSNFSKSNKSNKSSFESNTVIRKDKIYSNNVPLKAKQHFRRKQAWPQWSSGPKWGQWLGLSWLSGYFRHLRSTVSIRSSASFITEHLLTLSWIEKTKIKTNSPRIVYDTVYS